MTLEDKWDSAKFSAKVCFISLAIIGISNQGVPPTSTLEAAFSEPLGEWVQISAPTNCNVFSADFLNSEDGWAVGACNIPEKGRMFMRWNGQDWTFYPRPENTRTPWFVNMLAPDDGWIVGVEGMILHWNGLSWENIASTEEYTLSATSFLSSTLGWAVGGHLGYTPTDPENYSVILKWDGEKWKKVSNPGRFPLRTIVILSKDDGWAAGELGELLHWNGQKWQEYPAPDKDLVSAFSSLAFIDPGNGWLVGGSASDDWGVILHWDGKSWTEFQRTEHFLVSVALVDSDFGWAVGGNNDNNFGGSEILHWNGKTWEEYPSPTNLPLNFIWAETRLDGWLFAGGVSPNTLGEEVAIFRYVIKPTSTPTPSVTRVPTSAVTALPTSTIVKSFAPTLASTIISSQSSNASNIIEAVLIAGLLVLLIIVVFLWSRQRKV